MENRNTKILENLKKEINLLASDMEKQDAMLMEDEPEMQDYENQ